MGIYDIQDSNIRPAVGAPRSVWENITQSYEQQLRVDSPYSLGAEISEMWIPSTYNYSNRGGRPIDFDLSVGSLQMYARDVLGEDQSFWAKDIQGNLPEDARRNLEAFRAYNEEIKALNDPEVQSFDEVLQEVIQMQQELEEETTQMGEASGFAGLFGQFLGATAGSFSTRDPLNLATLGMGGVGKTVAARIATEMGLASAVTAATEYGQVQSNRELADLPYRNPMFDVAAAGVGAGVFEGAGSLIGGLLRRRRARNQQEAFDQRLNTYLAERPNLPRARAAMTLLETDAKVRQASPYGDSPAALRRFTGELKEIESLIAGRTSTAIARTGLPEIPVGQIEKAADFEIVKEVSPEIYARLERAEAAVLEVDNARVELEEELEATTVVDAVRLVDPEAANRIGVLLARAAEAEPNEAAGLELEANSIIDRVGREDVARAVEVFEKGPRRTLQSLRKKRRAANRRFKAAYKAVEDERVKLVRARERITAQPKSDLLGNVYEPTTPPGLRIMRWADIEETADNLKTGSEHSEAHDSALVSGYSPDNEKIDVGLNEDIDPDFEYLDIDGKLTTARSLMEDLDEDVRLSEAVRTCSV